MGGLLFLLGKKAHFRRAKERRASFIHQAELERMGRKWVWRQVLLGIKEN